MLPPDAEEAQVGTLVCGVAEPLPLTDDRIAAIRAESRAAKTVYAVFECKKCSSKLTLACSIETAAKLPEAIMTWYKDVLDEWRWSCNATVLDLTITKRNLHFGLGRIDSGAVTNSRFSFVRMYEKGTLADECASFGALLDADPEEEKVQVFLDEHPVFLHLFSPTSIKSLHIFIR